MLTLSSDKQSVTLQTLQAIEKSQRKYRTQNHDLLSRTRQDLLAEIQKSRKAELNSLQGILSSVVTLASTYSHQNIVLESLHFEGIQTRYNSIRGAHTDTFNWFFDLPDEKPGAGRPPHAFRRWLESGSGVYYITVCCEEGTSSSMQYLAK